MEKFNILRYTGSKHVSLIADKKDNSQLSRPIYVTAQSYERAMELIEETLELELGKFEEEPELAVTEFDKKKFTNLATKQLLKLYEKTESMLGAKEIMEEILIKRGAIEPEPVKEAPEKKEREYKKCMSDEYLQARLAEARKNYKKFCKFLCTKDKELHVGIIRSARLDKRSGFIQYRIEIIERPTEDAEVYTQKTGLIFGKADDSKDLEILEEQPAWIQF